MKFSRAVIDAGADVIFGHGPHIMRGMEFYKGRLIAYSLGNFCGYEVLSSDGFSGVGGVLKVTLNKDGSWVRRPAACRPRWCGRVPGAGSGQAGASLRQRTVAGRLRRPRPPPSRPADGTITPPAAD